MGEQRKIVSSPREERDTKEDHVIHGYNRQNTGVTTIIAVEKPGFAHSQQQF